MARIKTVSAFLQLFSVFWVVFAILMTVVVVAKGLQASYFLLTDQVGVIPHAQVRFLGYEGNVLAAPTTETIAAMLALYYGGALVSQAFAILTAVRCERLCSNLAKGELFTERNCRHLRQIAIFSIAWSAVPMLLGQSFTTTPFFYAGLIWFISWVLDEARKLNEEQALVV